MSDLWDGQFIDVCGVNLKGKLTIGNIYRPPRSNNDNTTWNSFITQETDPVMSSISNENSHAIVTGDFNIDLQQIDETTQIQKLLTYLSLVVSFPKLQCPQGHPDSMHLLLIRCTVNWTTQIYIAFPVSSKLLFQTITLILLFWIWLRIISSLNMLKWIMPMKSLSEIFVRKSKIPWTIWTRTQISFMIQITTVVFLKESYPMQSEILFPRNCEI